MLDIALFLGCITGGVPAENIEAIAYNESKQNPYALYIDDVGSFFPASKEEAEALIEKHQDHRMDVGYMQINSRVANEGYAINSPAELLDPCLNIRLGSDILHSFYQARLKKSDRPEQALFFALSAYNTGRYTVGFDNGYTDKYTIIDSNRPHGARQTITLSGGANTHE